MTYDYVIIGAGSAGCVLAERLSASGLHKVLLLEAGPPDSSPLIAMPKGFGKLLHDPRHVWSYQAGDGARNRTERWVRGKTLGGSSAVNGMMYTRGDPKEYDAWAADGCVGWGWPEVGAAFKAIEDHELGEDLWRGAGGPLGISMPRERNAVCDAWIAAGAAGGTPEKQDLNALDIEGVGYFPRTIKGGVRQSASTAFLHKARRRPNLTIQTGVTARRLVFIGTRVTGVVCDIAGEERVFDARAEIIVAAGALNSPQLLQRSGIGPAAVLRRAGVDVLVDAPDVGRNLREHRVIFMQWRLKRAALSHNRDLSGLRLLLSVLNYAAFKSGVLAQGAYEAGGFVKTRPDLARPDAQLLVSPFSLELGEGDADSVNLEQEPGVQCIAYPLRPTSLGYVEITGAQSDSSPRIDANYLDTEEDRKTAIGMVRFVRTLFETSPLRDLVTTETAPGPDVRTDEAILAAFQRYGGCGYHATGTCRMGSDEGSVVDPRLRVRGVQGLRVMDCSVMPTLASGNTNGPAMAMAWNAATMILADAA